MKRRWVFLVLLLWLGGGGLAACRSISEPDEVTLQLNWTHEVEFVGYYVAEARGFYADENLAVTVYEGGIGVDEYQLLLDRQADFAVTSLANQRRGMLSGQPIVAVAAIFQIPPPVVFALAVARFHKTID